MEEMERPPAPLFISDEEKLVLSSLIHYFLYTHLCPLSELSAHACARARSTVRRPHEDDAGEFDTRWVESVELKAHITKQELRSALQALAKRVTELAASSDEDEA